MACRKGKTNPEMTDKALFFARYLGQKVAFIDVGMETAEMIGVFKSADGAEYLTCFVEGRPWQGDIPYACLRLKRLVDIDREDAKAAVELSAV